MPASSTAVNGCDVVVKLEDESGQMIDISGSSNEISLDFSNDIGEFKPFGSRGRRRLMCGTDAKIALKAFYTQASLETTDLMKKWQFRKRTRRAIQVFIPDDSVGSDMYEGYVLLSTFSVPSKSDDANPIMLSADLLPDGEITWDIVT